MKKNRGGVFVSILLIIVFIAAVAGGAAYDVLTAEKEPKRGIVFCHALLAGSLYNADTGEALWDPFTLDDVNLLDFLNSEKMPSSVVNLFVNDREVLLAAVNKIIEKSPDSIMSQLILDEDGNSKTNVKACEYESYDSRLKYGALNAYKDLAESLTARYSEKSEVVLFNYDWRIDNRISGAQLEDFINKKGYDEVVLISHSMGGMVVSNYLARSEENREKVKLYCAYAAPFYGALMALSMLSDPLSLRDGFAYMLTDMGFEPLAEMLIDVYDDQFLPMITNMTSIYQLLPTADLLNTPQYSGGKSFVYVDGEPILTEDALYDFYLNADWVKNSKGEVKKAMREFKDYYEGMFVKDAEGKRVHVTSTVNTRYFYGSGLNTETACYFVNGAYAGSTYDKKSDSTVPYGSATLGLSLDSDVVYEIKGGQHDVIACDFSYVEEDTFAEIDKIWGENA